MGTHYRKSPLQHQTQLFVFLMSRTTMRTLFLLGLLAANGTAFKIDDLVHPILRQFGLSGSSAEEETRNAWTECHLFAEFLIKMDEYEHEYLHHDFESPDELMQLIVDDWGGEDNCIDVNEFLHEWDDIHMNGAPQTAFHEAMDINTNGCVTQPEMIQYLIAMGEKCMDVPI